MAKLQGGTRIYGTANVDTSVYVGTSNNTTGTGGVIANVTTVFIGNNTVSAFLNTTGLSINAVTIANTLGVYTGTVNAASHTISTTFVANTTGIYHTGLINIASVNVSTNTLSIGTAAYHVANGNFGIANAVPIDKLSVAGTSYFNGNAVFNGVAAFYNINGQSNASAGAFVGNAYATLGGSSGNYLAFGQQTSSAQWIQSGYSSAGAPVYYSIILNPLGGNIGIGNTAPSDRLSVNGNTYLQGTVTASGLSTFNANVVLTTPLIANGIPGTATWVLTSNGSTGSPYWALGGSGTFTGGTVTGATTFNANATLTTPLIANGSPGTATWVLTSNGSTGSPYWATGGGGGGSFTNGASVAVSNLAFTNSGGGSVGVAYSFINSTSNSLDTVFA